VAEEGEERRHEQKGHEPRCQCRYEPGPPTTDCRKSVCPLVRVACRPDRGRPAHSGETPFRGLRSGAIGGRRGGDGDGVTVDEPSTELATERREHERRQRERERDRRRVLRRSVVADAQDQVCNAGAAHE
jgi:hypothetical protein